MNKFVYMNEAGADGAEGGTTMDVTPSAPPSSLINGVEASKGPSVERPEWVLDKYATEDRSVEEAISEQAKAYVELQKQFGGFTGAPENYELAMPEGIEGEIDTELPQYQQFLEIAKNANMNQDTAQNLFNLFVEYQNENFGKDDIDLNAQKELLGPEADKRIQNLVSWAGNNLDQDDMATLESMTMTADQVQVLEKIIAKTRNTPTPKTHEVNAPVKGYSESDFHKDVGSERYRTDPKFRAEVRKRGAQLFGS